MAYSLKKGTKVLILLSSLSISVLLLCGLYGEIYGAEWRQHQISYKRELNALAKSRSELENAKRYEIKLRQVFLPKLNRVDRCTSCHVALEDPRMSKYPNPLRSHPGGLLEEHDVERFGCTVCHDGQGRAVTNDEAKARGDEYFWEKPLLPIAFVDSNCVRCHAVEDLDESSLVRKGKRLFVENGCLGCHKLNGRGNRLAPDLSHIGSDNPRLKRPRGPNAETYLERFSGNRNIAYIYESIAEPKAQPKTSFMLRFAFKDDELLALTAFLKGMSGASVPGPYQRRSFYQQLYWTKELGGKELFSMYCSACHGKGAVGSVPNPNAQTGQIPQLNRVKEAYLKPELVKLIKSGKVPTKKDPSGPEPIHMPSWKGALEEKEIDHIVDYLFSLMPEETDDW